MRFRVFNKKVMLIAYILLFALICSLMTGCTGQKTSEEATDERENYKIITDMRSKEVRIPKEPKRVVTVSDGLIESVMINFGVVDRLVGVGGESLKNYSDYKYTTYTGGSFSYTRGANPVLPLYPKIKDLPLLIKYGTGMNYEALAGLSPDIIIFRLGSCSLWESESENVKQTIERVESLGIPLVVLKAPNCYDKPDLETMCKEIEILGEIFNKQKQAKNIVNYFDKQVSFIKERTSNIKEQDKPKVLLLGLSSVAREKGGSGNVQGLDQQESVNLESIVNARNAYRGTGGHGDIMSAEQILALNPDIILLPTSWGYHPPRELYEGEHFRDLKDLKAIKEKRVYALPWLPCNCAPRLEVLINLMIESKAAYPDKFADVSVHKWVLDFYHQLYGVNDEMAKELRSAQWLDWMEEVKF